MGTDGAAGRPEAGRGERGRPEAGRDERDLTVMVVDDHPMWRDAVARDLEARGFQVVATADGVEAATVRAKATVPQVVLMDMDLGDDNGAVGTASVLAVSPASRVLVLSASAERDDVLEAVKAGATGYLVKSASIEDLVAAVTATARGDAVFTPGLAGLVLGEYRRMASAPPEDETPPALTDRETEILRMVAKGLSAKQIGAKLTLSHRTVENHVQATLRKLHLANRVELTRWAIERGL